MLLLSEKDFLQQIVDYAGYTGWLRYHPFDSRHSASGWPDLSLARAPEFLLAELKTEKGRLSRDQRRWIDELRACGLEVHVWRPRDWPEIEARLARPRRPDPQGRTRPRNPIEDP